MPPIIDVHAHIANARDIPLKGYLLSRSPESWLERTFLPPLAPILARALRDGLVPGAKRGVLTRAFGRIALRLACVALGSGVKGWAETLAKPVVEIVEELIDTYEKDSIDLFVPLLLDYEYWFENTPDNKMKDQIDFAYEHVVKPGRGRIHPFVPFDPARELAYRNKLKDPDGDLETCGSMNLVKDAIENKGFLGVKLYPAMGYKPLNNDTVELERRSIPMHHDRYTFSGEEYDEVLTELYDFCTDNDVPITAHCFMDGMESYKDASFHFGQAAFWRNVLDQEKYRMLRLNLAHFGWNKDQRHDGDRSWVREICKMLPLYPKLYTDVAHHRVILAEKKNDFVEDYRAICDAAPLVKKRLLFGIDWHVVKRVENFHNFKDCYLAVLKSSGRFTEDEIDDFLGGNALRFLGVMPGGRNRYRLEHFYEKEGMTPPDWFIEAGKRDTAPFQDRGGPRP